MTNKNRSCFYSKARAAFYLPFLGCFILCLLNIPCFASTFDEIYSLAEQGNAEAQFEIGNRYNQENSTEKQLQKAAEWYSKAAEQGHLSAICKLAHMYKEGHGVEKNLQKSLKLYTEVLKKQNFKDENIYMYIIDIKNEIAYNKIREYILYKNDNMKNKPFKINLYDEFDKISYHTPVSLLLPHIDIMSVDDDILIYDVIINRGNAEFIPDNSILFPLSLKFGNSLTGVIKGTKEVLEVKILTNRGIALLTNNGDNKFK